MTTVRLVVGHNIPRMLRSFAGFHPALLISYAYKALIPKDPLAYSSRGWALDSGAFTAYTQGKPINLGEYIAFVLERLRVDSLLSEVFALDVMFDPAASLANTEAMWVAGVPAIPVFHYGEPWEFLHHMAARYPKIAIGGGGRLPATVKLKWTEQCFARVYPKKIHGLGFGRGTIPMRFPFHSIDASSWVQHPAAFGMYNGYNDPLMCRQPVNIPSCQAQSIGPEALWYMRLERYLKDYWGEEMARLEALPRLNPRSRA